MFYLKGSNIDRKNNIFTPDTHVCISGGKKASFSENFENLLNE